MAPAPGHASPKQGLSFQTMIVSVGLKNQNYLVVAIFQMPLVTLAIPYQWPQTKRYHGYVLW